MPEIIWGVNPVLESLKAEPEKIEEIIIVRQELRGKVYQILERAQKAGVRVKLKETLPSHLLPPNACAQGVLAKMKAFTFAPLESLFQRAQERQEKPLFLAVDEITDPQNLGNLIRSAEAAGAHGVILPKHRTSSLTGTVVKASAGAIAHLPLCQVTNLGRTLETLKDRGLWITGLAGEAESSIYQLDLSLPLVWVVGSEGKGLRRGIRKKCDFLASIPMRGKIDSLNAAVAGAIALFETVRQRFFEKR